MEPSVAEKVKMIQYNIITQPALTKAAYPTPETFNCFKFKFDVFDGHIDSFLKIDNKHTRRNASSPLKIGDTFQTPRPPKPKY